MPAFFVHGVPDTHLMWGPLISHLSRKDVIAVDMPGFSAPVPPGWNATKEEYVDWLIGEIEKVGEPVDLVGHDWGSLITQRVVSLRSDLIRTWAAGAGVVHSEYTWHDVARIWQTPGMGEQFMQGMTADTMKVALGGAGVPADYLDKSTKLIDDLMKDCILKLYRSAVNFSVEWEPDLLKVTRPALLIWGKNDPYMAAALGEALAKRLDGEFLALDCGHWWPLEKPAETAAALERFWAEPSAVRVCRLSGSRI
jgi:pimeloyl-ACP methyl ester carboxylesterase